MSIKNPRKTESLRGEVNINVNPKSEKDRKLERRGKY
jgi:hypothetical protein